MYGKSKFEIIANLTVTRFPQTWHWRGVPPSYQILISFSNLWLKYLYDWFYFQERFEKNRAQVPPKNPCIFRLRAKSKMAASTNLKNYLKDITFEPEHIDSYVKTLFWINRPRGLRLWHHFDVWTSFWYKNPRWPPCEWFPVNLCESRLVPYVEQEMLTISGTSDSDFIPFGECMISSFHYIIILHNVAVLGLCLQINDWFVCLD